MANHFSGVAWATLGYSLDTPLLQTICIDAVDDFFSQHYQVVKAYELPNSCLFTYPADVEQDYHLLGVVLVAN